MDQPNSPAPAAPSGESDQQRLHRLGHHVRRRRHTLMRTQEQVALSARLSRAELSRIENGRAQPTVLMLYRIADALDCDIRDLLAT